MNILIACDSFKDALDAFSVSQAIEKGLLMAHPTFTTRLFPLADGGEGMSEMLRYHLGLRGVTVTVADPLGRPVAATYNVSADGTVAFIEMAQASGLQLLAPAERNPLLTSTFGTGEMVAHALRHGAQRIVLGIGGSATNDLGTGLATALGWRFLDQNGAILAGNGGNLAKIARIVPPETPLNIPVEVVCDVTNPLLGPSGAAAVYAPQKGANAEQQAALEAGAAHMVQVAGLPADFAAQPGAGAAGGLGFGAVFFLGGQLRRGIDALMDLTQFDAQVAWADLIITGEGRLDSQTAHGKLIAGIVQRANGRKVIAFCGALEMQPEDVQKMGLWSAFSIANKPLSLPDALAHTRENLERTAFLVGRMLE